MPRITKEQKTKVWEYFSARKWPKNQRFPKQNGDDHLDEFLRGIGLFKNRKKASDQLKLWKHVTYDHASTVLQHTKETALEVIQLHMNGVDHQDFTRKVLERMLGSQATNDDPLYKICLSYIQLRQEHATTLLNFCLKQPKVIASFARLISEYEMLLASIFPKQLKMKAGADLLFSVVRQKKSSVPSGAWYKLFWQSIEGIFLLPWSKFSVSESIVEWQHLFIAVEMAMYNCWRIQNYNRTVLPIVIPQEASVHRSSKKVVAYVAGWILHEMKNHAGLRKAGLTGMQVHATSFTSRHGSKTHDDASSDLPTSYLKIRQSRGKQKLLYPSTEFYEFVSRLETVYVNNFSLKMLISHSAGSLVETIHQAILDDSSIFKSFSDLWGHNYSNATITFFYKYVLSKYNNMRKKWFGRSVKALRRRKMVDRLENGSLRTRVAATCIKAEKTAAFKTETNKQAGNEPGESTTPTMEKPNKRPRIQDVINDKLGSSSSSESGGDSSDEDGKEQHLEDDAPMYDEELDIGIGKLYKKAEVILPNLSFSRDSNDLNDDNSSDSECV